MARGLLLAVVLAVALAVMVYAMSKYAYPEYIRLKEKHLEKQTTLKEKELERDQALVEEAEREYEERK